MVKQLNKRECVVVIHHSHQNGTRSWWFFCEALDGGNWTLTRDPAKAFIFRGHSKEGEYPNAIMYLKARDRARVLEESPALAAIVSYRDVMLDYEREILTLGYVPDSAEELDQIMLDRARHHYHPAPVA